MTIIEQAEKQDKLKSFHESKLAPQLKTIFRQMTKDLKDKYISTQTLLDPLIYEPEFKAALTNRSRLVANDFKNTYRSMKGIEEDINVDIAEFIALFVDQQLGFISNTTEQQQREMLSQVFRDLNIEGIQATNEIVAQRLSEKFLRSGLARSELISSEVVSGVAEEAKTIEMSNLIATGAIVADAVIKTWVTTIDGRERDTHHAAHLQKRPMNVPFNVGSSRLQYPKDTSLGADMKEIYNCRCNAIYT